MTFMPITIAVLCSVTEGSLKGLENIEISVRVETIQNTTLLRFARILRGVLET